jgi:hypothetical protein
MNPEQGQGGEEGSSNIFLNLKETDSTGIPSLKNAPESVISTSANESKVSPQMAVALGVIAVGAGMIYAMRYIGMKAGLDEQVVSIDYTSQTSNADFNKRFGRMIGELDESSIAVQFGQETEFTREPFSRPRAMGATPQPVVKADPGMSEEERLALQRERELEFERQRRHDAVVSEAMSFHLQGVVGGSRPAARVSGQAVAVGSKLGEFFKVTKITGRSVIIEADGMKFEVALGEATKQID